MDTAVEKIISYFLKIKIVLIKLRQSIITTKT